MFRMSNNQSTAKITIAEFQKLIRDMYLEKDVARGIDGTFMWLMEEVGELSAALRGGNRQQQAEEFADVLATKLADPADQLAVGQDMTAHRRGQGVDVRARGQVQRPVEGEDLEVIVVDSRTGRRLWAVIADPAREHSWHRP